MTSSIASVSSNLSTGSAVTSSIAVGSDTSSRKAQLEKQLAIYTEELAEAQKAATDKDSALRIQLLQQQILAVQQQIAQLSVSSSIALPTSQISSQATSASSSSGPSTGTIGASINTFA